MNKLLENHEIRLRAIEPEDLDLLYEWENDTQLWAHGASIAPFSRYAIKEYLINAAQDIYQLKQLRLMVELKTEKTAIGTVDLYDFDPFHRRAGVGILIRKSHHRQGFALQTLSLLEEYAFGFLKMKQLYAFVPQQNTASTTLFQKAGYAASGTLSAWLSHENGFSDVVVLQRINPMEIG